MRREAMFSGDSPYEIMVRNNLLLHDEVSAVVEARVAPLLDARGGESPIAVLDLACGVPITMAALMEQHPECSFRYTGIDINPDQVARAGELLFPNNVETLLLEGSAWDLAGLDLGGPFDVAFIGLNWHHGTPEEVWFLATQLRELLAPDGIVVNHDCYRPEGTAYLRRPGSVTANGESVSIEGVAAERLVAAGVPDFGLVEETAEQRPEWKTDFIARLAQGLRDGGGDDAAVDISDTHSWARDYPMSLGEVREVLESAGFEVRVDRFADGTGPMAPFTAVVSAIPS